MACPWLKHALGMPAALVRGPALAVLVLSALACDAPATATPVPTSAPIPTSTVAPTPRVTPEPTAVMVNPVSYEPYNWETTLADYWNPPMDFYGEPVYGGMLRISHNQPLEHGNVWGAANEASEMLRAPTGATLVMEDPYNPGGPIIPDLAAIWEIHEGHDGVTFHFRKSTKWHNGEPFVCEDARFSFETMITGEGLTHSYMRDRLGHVVLEEMSCLDDLTLELNFSNPTAIPLHYLSNSRALVFNKDWFQEGGEEVMFQDVSMGIGPFKWLEGQVLGIDIQYFDKNPDYFVPELPYVDALVIIGIGDESVRQAAHLAH